MGLILEFFEFYTFFDCKSVAKFKYQYIKIIYLMEFCNVQFYNKL